MTFALCYAFIKCFIELPGHQHTSDDARDEDWTSSASTSTTTTTKRKSYGRGGSSKRAKTTGGAGAGTSQYFGRKFRTNKKKG